MKKNELRKQSDESTSSQYGRREFLSASLLTGSFCFLGIEAEAKESFDETDELLKNVSVADSLVLYTNLLDDVQQFVLHKEYVYVADRKNLASEQWGEMVRLADELREITPRPTIANAEQTNKLFQFVNIVSSSRKTLNEFDKMRKIIHSPPSLLHNKISTIKTKMLDASQKLKDNLALDIQSQAQNLKEAMKNIDEAIKGLANLTRSNNEINQREIMEIYNRHLITPEEFIDLLKSVKDSVVSAPTASNNRLTTETQSHFLPIRYNETKNQNAAVAASIGTVLRRYIRPGSWLQIATAYALVLPTMTTRGEKRKNLLRRVLANMVERQYLEPASNELASI